MARIGGRNRWIAVPAGLACLAAVVGLGYLAAPAVPGAIAWTESTLQTATRQTGDLLRQAEATPAAPARGALAQVESDADLDCRDLYPKALWAELVLYPRTLLLQNSSAPATAVEGVVEAAAPRVRVTCKWRLYEGGVASTTASIVADPAVAVAALQAAGFECAPAGEVQRCSRVDGETREEHDFGGTVWLATTSTGELPEGYTDRLVAGLWSGG